MSSQLNQDLGAFETHKDTLFDRVFRDSQGNIVIAQMPNLPISIGLVATLLLFIIPSSEIQTLLGLVAFGTLFTWAWQELFDGVNYFRRGLGLVSLVGIITLVFKLSV
ncbi:MAG TPA: hypothetical protein V6D07_09660 [Trichocoleus sp.]